jgi:hypothetical protein
MGKREVTFSAAGGVLRVWNPTPVDAKVFVGEKEAIVSPGCMKEFALPEGTGFEVVGVGGQSGVPRQVQDAPYSPPGGVFPDEGLGADALDAAEDPAPAIVESIKQGISDAAAAAGIVEIPLGVPPAPSAHHELNLDDVTGTKDRMGVPLPEGQVRGRRVPDDTENFAPGDYGRLGGRWMANAPGGHLGDLTNHEVTEHEDGTITVSPSILISARVEGVDRELWHGFLERGIWRKA